jgi:hypothetical protein
MGGDHTSRCGCDSKARFYRRRLSEAAGDLLYGRCDVGVPALETALRQAKIRNFGPIRRKP